MSCLLGAVKIRQPGVGIFGGNANELGYAGGSSGISYLFILTAYGLGIGLSGDKVQWWQDLDTCVGSRSLSTVLETPRELFVFKPADVCRRV
jgi:hypothetical protein